MAFRAISASPGFAGKLVVVSAVALRSAALLVHRPLIEQADIDLPDGASDAPASAAAAPPQAPASANAPAFRVETAVVEHSFAEAAQRLGVDAATTARLARAFSGRLDFRRDLQRGSEIRFVFRNEASGANEVNGASGSSATATQDA